MAIEIDDDVLAKTKNCKDSFQCLSGESACLCDVLDSKSFSLVKIKSKTDISCNYLFPFNKSSFCRCPTRNEIYKRYSR